MMRQMGAYVGTPLPERTAELALCCARVALDGEQADRARALLEEEIAWDHLLPWADRHRVSPLLCASFSKLDPSRIPAETWSILRDRFASNAKRSLRITAELVEILTVFGDHGIQAVPYKGPVLAQQLYGSVALRRMGDIDILVERGDASRARDLLLARGYRTLYDTSPAQGRVLTRSDCNLVLVRDEDASVVELHWAFAAGRHSFSLSLAAATRQSGEIRLAGVPVVTFGSDELLLILCFHGSRHMWERLEWICGVAELLRRSQFDWSRIVDMAARSGVARALLLGLSLAHELLDAPVPDPLLARIKADRAVPELRAQILTYLLSADEPPALAHRLGLPYHLFQLRSKERIRDRLRYAAYTGFHPAKEDWSAVRIPDPMFALYWIIRPIRLLREYASRWSQI